MKKWTKLSRRILLKHPRLTVYEDTVKLPSGHNTEYLHFGFTTDAAQVIAINSSGEILVQKEYSYPINDWLYQFPGGAINKGEKPDACALRELSEEADLSGDLTMLGWFYVDNRRKSDKFYVFLAKNLKEAVGKADIEEEFEYCWLKEADIDQMLRDGKVVNYSMLSGWALYKAHIMKT
jgi:ADP-ribose pyrophosphatase